MKVLIADDSAIIRAMLEQNLKKEKDIDIVASVSNGRKAVDAAQVNCPDIAICDIDMPEMNGLDATKLLTKMGIPVVIFSEDIGAETRAKAAGAVAFFVKPNLVSFTRNFFEPFIIKLRELCSLKKTVRTFSKQADSFFEKGNSSLPNFKILCIGASTGGPTAVQEVLSGLGTNFPLPILYVQHIEIGADEKMAGWFDSSCKNIKIALAKDGEEAKPGCVYMAPADKHLIIDFCKSNGNPVLKLSDEPPVRFLRPAVDKLFFSAASFYKRNCLAVLLTGMGRDGADGCKAIVDAGGYTIVEDESTCAVFGMPAAAIEVGGASKVMVRNEIAAEIKKIIGAR